MKKKIDREKAILNLRIEAQERIIKDEVMRFRLEADTFRRLLKLSGKLKKPAGTMVREWVIEKLDQIENAGTESPQVKAISIIADSLAKKGLLKDDQIGRIHKLLTDQSNEHASYY